MFSTVIRRIHMYLALFLTPWVLIYALSTMSMNHRDFFKEHYGGSIVRYEKEREQVYAGTFSEDVRAWMIAEKILADLDLEGTYGVRRNREKGTITIVRQDPITPRRITYTPADGKLLVEREVFRAPSFLERMHRRRGYRHKYALEDLWAFSVDLVIVAMVFWGASGLWMWWELKPTRRWGTICVAAGVALFGFFLLTI